MLQNEEIIDRETLAWNGLNQGAQYEIKTRPHNTLDVPWFTDLNQVKDTVPFLSNQGYYKRSGIQVRKKLDYGHTFTDWIESQRIGYGKLRYRGEPALQSINYQAPWQYMCLANSQHLGDTQLRGAHGRVLQPGTYMFVICKDGHIRYFPNHDGMCERGDGTKHYLQYLPHAALAKHRSVLAAGNICVNVEGYLIWATSNSGHYRVNDRMCKENLYEALRRLGYDYTAVHDGESSNANNDNLMGQESGEAVRTNFTFLPYQICKDYQNYVKSRRNLRVSLGGVRPVRSELVTLIKQKLRDIHTATQPIVADLV